MRLFLELQGAQTGSRMRGIGRYTRDLTNALIETSGPEDSLYLGWNATFPSPLEDLSFRREAAAPREIVSAPYGVWERPSFSRNVHDVYQTVNDRIFRHALTRSRCRHVLFSSLMETDDKDFNLPLNLNFWPHARSYAIIYDIIPYLFPENYLPAPPFVLKYMSHLRVKLSADVLFSISEKTRRDIIDHFAVDPDRVINIGAGIDLSNFPKGDPGRSELDHLGINRPYLLYLGGDEFRKNLFGFIDALEHLSAGARAGLQVVICGKVSEEHRKRIVSATQAMGWQEDAIVLCDYLTEEALRQAYNGCALTVIPSIYEGFGLPVLEAMASDAAVIASGNTSMSEIVDDTRFLFDPRNPRQIADRIEYVLSHPDEVNTFKSTYAKTLSAYTWAAVAGRVRETMDHVAERDARLASRYQPVATFDLALLGPGDGIIEAAVCGIAKKNAITLFVDDKGRGNAEKWPVAIASVGALSDREEAGPTVVFISEASSFLALVASKQWSDKILVFTEGALAAVLKGEWSFESLRLERRYRKIDHAACLNAIAAVFSCWTITETGLREITLEGGLQAGGATGSCEGVAAVVIAEVDRFRAMTPSFLASDISRVLSRRGIKHSARRHISEAVAISVFDWTRT